MSQEPIETAGALRRLSSNASRIANKGATPTSDRKHPNSNPPEATEPTLSSPGTQEVGFDWQTQPQESNLPKTGQSTSVDRSVGPDTHPQSQTGETSQFQEVGSSSLLRTHGLKKVYDGRAVVNGVDIHVNEGEIVGLLGPNGAGKTTTFYMIVGLVPPNGGKVIFNGHEATQLPMYKRARLGMGYLPQEESIFRKLTVRENIMAVMETLKIGRKERKQRCEEVMEQFGIAHVQNNLALTLSGGEKRRLTIARSLVTNPKLLMLDEPFSGVDPIAVSEIQEIILKLKEAGLAILITDHNVRETLTIVDRAYLIFEGKVERHGTRDFLVNDPMSRELYLGERFSM